MSGGVISARSVHGFVRGFLIRVIRRGVRLEDGGTRLEHDADAVVAEPVVVHEQRPLAGAQDEVVVGEVVLRHHLRHLIVARRGDADGVVDRGRLRQRCGDDDRRTNLAFVARDAGSSATHGVRADLVGACGTDEAHARAGEALDAAAAAAVLVDVVEVIAEGALDPRARTCLAGRHAGAVGEAVVRAERPVARPGVVPGTAIDVVAVMAVVDVTAAMVARSARPLPALAVGFRFVDAVPLGTRAELAVVA